MTESERGPLAHSTQQGGGTAIPLLSSINPSPDSAIINLTESDLFSAVSNATSARQSQKTPSWIGPSLSKSVA